jgi:hypothetical protein
MASITLKDLTRNEALDRKAMQSIKGAAGEGNWVLDAFATYIAPVAGPKTGQTFNFLQQTTNNYTYIGQLVNQVTNVDITNSGANSTNNAVVLPSLGNQT